MSAPRILTGRTTRERKRARREWRRFTRHWMRRRAEGWDPWAGIDEALGF